METNLVFQSGVIVHSIQESPRTHRPYLGIWKCNKCDYHRAFIFQGRYALESPQQCPTCWHGRIKILRQTDQVVIKKGAELIWLV